MCVCVCQPLPCLSACSMFPEAGKGAGERGGGAEGAKRGRGRRVEGARGKARM